MASFLMEIKERYAGFDGWPSVFLILSGFDVGMMGGIDFFLGSQISLRWKAVEWAP